MWSGCSVPNRCPDMTCPETAMSRNGYVPKWLCPEVARSRNGYVPKRLCPEVARSRSGYVPNWLGPEVARSRNVRRPAQPHPQDRLHISQCQSVSLCHSHRQSDSVWDILRARLVDRVRPTVPLSYSTGCVKYDDEFPG